LYNNKLNRLLTSEEIEILKLLAADLGKGYHLVTIHPNGEQGILSVTDERDQVLYPIENNNK